MFRKSSPMRATASKSSRLAWVAAGTALAAALAGCSTTSREYPGVGRDALWNAAVGAARHPAYSNWTVAQNGVFTDEPSGRIEVYRELKRDFAPPGSGLERQSETWTYSVQVDMSDRIPRVILDTRSGLRTPAFRRQADHYFEQIDARLAQLPPDQLAKPAVVPPPSAPSGHGLEAP